MRRLVVLVLAVVFIAAILSYTVTYTVRFTEAAVLTTFGKAHLAEGGANDGSAGAIKTKPGLYFKWPSPIQSVTTYDTRLRFLQARSQTQQTADNRQIIVEAYCVWRVADPLKFFQRFSNAGDRAEDHYRRAEETIQSNLRSGVGVTSRYAMSDLFSPTPGATKLPELEKAILAAMTQADQSGQSMSEYGVKVEDVGVSRVVLPEDTTKAVFERMGVNRDRLAKEIEAQGEAEAGAIRTQAVTKAQTIRSFAMARAQDIRKEGDLEAAQFLKQMDAKPELAVFLKNMDMVRDLFGKRTTMVLPISTPGLGALSPNFLDGLKPGQIPTIAEPPGSPPAKPRGTGPGQPQNTNTGAPR